MEKSLKVICVGSPIVDRLAHVDENTLDRLAGGKGGMQLVQTDDMTDLMERLQAPVAVSPGGSAANTAFALARLDVPAAILGKVGDDGQGRFYRRTFEETGGSKGIPPQRAGASVRYWAPKRCAMWVPAFRWRPGKASPTVSRTSNVTRTQPFK